MFAKQSNSWFSKPQVMTTGRMTPKSDMYSWAVLAWECITGTTPYMPQQQHGGTVQAIGSEGAKSPDMVWSPSFPNLPDSCPPLLQDVVYACLDPNPQERPTWELVLRCLSAVALISPIS